MHITDTFGFAIRALRGARARSALMLLAMAIGIASVVLLTALGEGARRYVGNEFSNLGTHLLVVLPGRTETTGGPPPLIGGTPKPLTLDDALALTRSTTVRYVAPLIVGSAPVSHRQLEREATILGATAELLPVRNLELARGKFLPPGDPERGAAVAVIGSALKQNLFGNAPALGRWIRIHDRRFRVIGILKPMGESLGMDLGELAIIPLSRSQSLFDTESLFRILVQATTREHVARTERAVSEILKTRHGGEEDITVITQNALLGTFDEIFRTLTLAVGGIAAISLAVAGILIMNVMLVAVSQRTAEIGLLKALGAPGGEILRLFLVEAGLLSVTGALLGMATAYGGVWAMGHLFPDFPIGVPPWALAAALLVALLTGLLFGVLPARRAARLDPVRALSGH
ncbi:MAG: peptide ABC transporter permease [Candidatus Sedimenticola endophacoides]|uniref:Peptide ABC transporter permease n=1 Tax=Candidatus Sedimenticola endophacoides TaxID=2548426 RepID=A0A657PHT6_9GAMM|nr:MAG: peptide ABC transporter permease [Candidatus Sedimenticola endophacoides]OQX32625.1 MAG: peptide ABC transporter permease [Candidatus Sedimenticola endophacoides]OQX33132.1 MAG: peptide ABC transporter permease [Candidatus Sedimenticola endophacoides]OQX38477.1 MAG: peptide ABC transporter permease [Candidatus Sedimenticola endophacoides]PUE02681.1 MAG: peptide ABC transporter permease [Candidatus Sedimenticola endophacoides]